MAETNLTLQKISKFSLIAGIVGFALCLLGWATQPQAFAFAYLPAWLFWFGDHRGIFFSDYDSPFDFRRLGICHP